MTYSFTGFTPKADTALNNAILRASGAGHTYVGSEHLLLALTEDATGVAGTVLRNRKVDKDAVLREINALTGTGIPTLLSDKDITPRLKKIITSAVSLSRQEGLSAGTGHLLQALMNDRKCAGVKIVTRLGVSPGTILSDLTFGAKGAGALLGNTTAEKKKGEAALLKYGTDLSVLAREGRLDPVQGREKELDRVIRILCRRTKNNPCLIGEPGVGKTAVAEALAQRIEEGRVPEALRGKRIVSLELNRMVAGAKYRGDFEERVRDVINEVKSAGNVVLFIDELHNIMGAGSAEGAVDAANILKPVLARGELRLIGATTFDEYRKNIEKDKALSRRFQTVNIPEPGREESVKILRCLREKYEKHHMVRISDEALTAAVDLSIRFIPERFLPDKAIDLLDEACAKKSALGKINAKVGAEDIAEIAEETSGVPVSKLLHTEKNRLLHLEEELENAVIGQSAAVKTVADAVRRARIGLADPLRPMGIFLFCGPTGVGKTLLAKTLAEAVFGDKNALIYTDMSLYSQSHASSSLFGAPPGYVGFDEGETLVRKVKKKPYCVLLFDEIEKAHPDIFPELLSLMDEGKITSSDGETADCRHTIIIMTSNIGDKTALGGLSALGFGGAGGDVESGISEELKSYFRPEFINRIDETVVFRRLTENDLKAVAQKMLSSLSLRASDTGVALSFSEALVNFIAGKFSSSPYGARPIRRFIVSEIESPLARLLLSDKAAGEITVGIKDGKVDFCFR